MWQRLTNSRPSSKDVHERITPCVTPSLSFSSSAPSSSPSWPPTGAANPPPPPPGGPLQASGGGIGLLLAALIGILGAALKPSSGPSKDQAIEAASLLAAYEEKAEVEASWPIWEGFVLPSLSMDEPAVRFVSDGIEVCDEMLVVRSTSIARVTAKQAKAIAQQRAIKAELSHKDLSSSELFNLGLALIQAKKGLLA
jgi:hypothetical protein